VNFDIDVYDFTKYCEIELEFADADGVCWIGAGQLMSVM